LAKETIANEIVHLSVIHLNLANWYILLPFHAFKVGHFWIRKTLVCHWSTKQVAPPPSHTIAYTFQFLVQKKTPTKKKLPISPVEYSPDRGLVRGPT